jgi:hypothetical protein
MATDTAEAELSHEVFVSTHGGQTCSASGIPDAGTLPDGTQYTGNGKFYHDVASDRLVEP